MLKTADFDYFLPKKNIAQQPLEQRDSSRLLVLDRSDGSTKHQYFTDLEMYLTPGDVLVINNSRVIPARLLGRKVETQGKVEFLLLEKLSALQWRVMAGGSRISPGLEVRLHDKQDEPTSLVAHVEAAEQGSIRIIRFDEPVEGYLEAIGHPPLPPYIHRRLEDPERYQTVYNNPEGSAAAPTAGLHFTPELLLKLRRKGILIEEITLHVGLDTFKPVESEEVGAHKIHSEWSKLSTESARRINEAKLAGNRIVAVGTTSVRVLETAALRSAGVTGSLSQISDPKTLSAEVGYCAWRPVAAFEGRTDLYIYPGYRFRAVDVMITNFHLPQSSLILMVSAFAGWDQVKSAYQEALESEYRFYSFGDAMLII